MPDRFGNTGGVGAWHLNDEHRRAGLEPCWVLASLQQGANERRALAKVAEDAADYRAMSPRQIGQLIARLEQDMYRHAENLEFEQAAQVRDRIHAIRETALRGNTLDVGAL